MFVLLARIDWSVREACWLSQKGDSKVRELGPRSLLLREVAPSRGGGNGPPEWWDGLEEESSWQQVAEASRPIGASE